MGSIALVRTAVTKWRRAEQRPVGLRLRQALRYGWELASARVHLRGATLVGAHARTLGRPRIANDGRLRLGAHVLLRSVNVPVELAVDPGAELTIGDGCRLNYGVSIAATERVTIGAHVRIGPYVSIADTDFHDLHRRGVRPPSQPVVIEDQVWIGAKASVMRGVRIGYGAVVGTASVVTRDVPPFAIVAGVPARIVGQVDATRFEPEALP
jgi:acetyltransferase-like isoleucine patch superfamily enzyme